MKSIYIPQLLKAPKKKEEITIEESLSDLVTLTPVRGRIIVRHCGNYLDVSVRAETIVTLTCDRCLGNYNHRLSLDTSEIIWLEDPSVQNNSDLAEKEVQLEDLSETLPPNGYFDPNSWLYEQLCLAMPVRQLCEGENCEPPVTPTAPESQPPLDSRWATLASLKNNFHSK
jgi:uncharacterized protein